METNRYLVLIANELSILLQMEVSRMIDGANTVECLTSAAKYRELIDKTLDTLNRIVQTDFGGDLNASETDDIS